MQLIIIIFQCCNITIFINIILPWSMMSPWMWALYNLCVSSYYAFITNSHLFDASIILDRHANNKSSYISSPYKIYLIFFKNFQYVHTFCGNNTEYSFYNKFDVACLKWIENIPILLLNLILNFDYIIAFFDVFLINLSIETKFLFSWYMSNNYLL